MNSRGVTLPELVIAIGISSLIALSLATIFIQNNKSFTDQQLRVNQGIDSATAMDKIGSVIKQSNAVVAGYPAQNPQYTSSSTTLVLTTNSIDQSSSPIEDVYDYIILSKDPPPASVLRLRIFPNAQSYRKSANQVLAKDLSGLTFIYLDASKHPTSPTTAKVVSYSLNLSSKLGNQTKVSSSSGQTTLRNN